MVYIKTYIFNHFYEQYLVLLTMVPRNSPQPYHFTILASLEPLFRFGFIAVGGSWVMAFADDTDYQRTPPPPIRLRPCMT